MNARTATGLLLIAFGLGGLPAPSTFAQQPEAKPKDEALDDLLQKLSDPSDGSASKSSKSKGDASDSKKTAKKASETSKGRAEEPAKTSPAPKGEKTSAPKQTTGKPAAPAKVSEKDEALDSLLEKLGETKDEPSPDDRPRGGPGGSDKKPGPSSPGQGKPEPEKLTGKDKETDEHLEELTGRRRKRKPDDGQRSGEVGEMIKEMRDVEEKLGKPDPSETTRAQQKKIVKHIDTMIEQAKRSGSSMRMMVRQVRQQGQRPGQQQGQPSGQLARGASPMKPLPPTGKHSTAGGKHIWGHLPPELRQEIENQSNEEPLSTKKEMIDRYYLSVGKGKLVREE